MGFNSRLQNQCKPKPEQIPARREVAHSPTTSHEVTSHYELLGEEKVFSKSTISDRLIQYKIIYPRIYGQHQLVLKDSKNKLDKMLGR